MICNCCDQRIKIGQAQLTEAEKRRYDWGGPNDDANIIKAQCVKAAAVYYDVPEWMDYWDPTLSIGENIELMRQQDSQTMREIGRV